MWNWVLNACIILPSLIDLGIFIRYVCTRPLEELFLADCETWLRNRSICFKNFFVAMLVGYAALGIGWIRPISASRGLERQKRATSTLLVIESFTGYLIIVISSVGFLVAGSESERLQVLLPLVGGPIFNCEQTWLT